MRSLQKLGTILLGVALAAFIGGCGGSASNDQGTTFLHLGYYQIPDGQMIDACGLQLPQGLAGLSLPLSVIQGEGDGFEFVGGSGFSLGYVGGQNNLAGQAINVRRVFVDYVIQGSSVQPPSTTLPINMILGPSLPQQGQGGGGAGAGVEEEPGTDSSLPNGFQNLCNRGFIEIILVPNDILEWLNLNRNSLPEAPFTLEVNTQLEGRTTAGDLVRSQAASIMVVVTPDNTINPNGA